MTEYNRRVARYLKGKRAFIFDWDDTLIDSKTGKLAQNKAIAAEFGVKRSDEQVEELYRNSRSLHDMLEALCEHRASHEEIMKVVRRDYNKPEFAKRKIENADKSVRRLLELGYRTALFTAASAEIVEQDMRDVDFDRNVFGDNIMHVSPGMSKRDPRAFAEVISWLQAGGIAPSQAVYVGDGIGDMEGAREANLGFIGIEQGFVSAEEFAKNDALSLPGVQRLAMIATNLAPRPQREDETNEGA